MGSAFLFVFYFLFLTAILLKLNRKFAIGLADWQVCCIFFLKSLLGCVYGYIFLKYYHGDDTWNFFNDSLLESKELFQHPASFLNALLPARAFQEAGNFWQGVQFYLRNLEYHTMVKLLALLNIISRSNYYIDVLWFNFLTIWGPILLFRLLKTIFPEQKAVLIICLFFIPTIGFWLSGIRAEGLLLLFIAIILYYTNQWFQRRNLAAFLWIIFGLAGSVIYRFQYLLILLPAYIAWTMSMGMKRKAIHYFLMVYGACALIFVVSMFISPERNLASPIVSRQQDFALLNGNTRFDLDRLEPTASSFLKVLPQAFSHTFLRPWIWEAKGLLQIAAALEIMAFWACCVLLISLPTAWWKERMGKPILLLFVFYGLSQMLLIGYTVPFPGAIIRYKCIPELFLIITMALSIDWKKIHYKLK